MFSLTNFKKNDLTTSIHNKTTNEFNNTSNLNINIMHNDYISSDFNNKIVNNNKLKFKIRENKNIK